MLSINGWDKLKGIEHNDGKVVFKVIMANPATNNSPSYVCLLETDNGHSIGVSVIPNESNFTVEVKDYTDSVNTPITIYKDWWKPKAIALRNPKVFLKKIVDESNKQHRFSFPNVATGSQQTTNAPLWNLNNF